MKEKGVIAIIPVKGTIISEESFFGLVSPSHEIIGTAEDVEKKKKVKAVIFERN